MVSWTEEKALGDTEEKSKTSGKKACTVTGA